MSASLARLGKYFLIHRIVIRRSYLENNWKSFIMFLLRTSGLRNQASGTLDDVDSKRFRRPIYWEIRPVRSPLKLPIFGMNI